MKRIIFSVIVVCALFGSCKNTPTTPTPTPTPTKVYPIIDSFTASRTHIFSNSSVTLSWSTTDATRIIITPIIGDVAVSGTKQVTLTETTTFTLTAENNDGAVTKQVQVIVDLQDPCKTIAIAYYAWYSTYFHLETSPNRSAYDVANIEYTVKIYDKDDNLIDWGKATIPIIKVGDIGIIDIFLQNGKGLVGTRAPLTMTNCNAMTSQLIRQGKELKIR